MSSGHGLAQGLGYCNHYGNMAERRAGLASPMFQVLDAPGLLEIQVRDREDCLFHQGGHN